MAFWRFGIRKIHPSERVVVSDSGGDWCKGQTPLPDLCSRHTMYELMSELNPYLLLKPFLRLIANPALSHLFRLDRVETRLLT